MIDRFIVNGFLTRGAGHAIQPSITRGHAELTPGAAMVAVWFVVPKPADSLCGVKNIVAEI